MSQPESTRWLNSTVFGIGMASLFSDLSHETVTALLPALLASFGVASAVLGLIEGVADGLSTIAKFSGGWWTDRLQQRKPLCAIGYGTMALATGLIAAATTWPLVLAGRGVAWLARGLRTPARKALLAEAVTPATYGRGFGFERSMDTVGAVIAPVAALFLLKLGTTHRQVLWISVVPAFLAAAAIVFLVRERTDRAPNVGPFLTSLHGLPRVFQKFLRGVGLFGTGDFSHSLMILYAVTTLTPTLGPARSATAGVALYALQNVIYAAISYPAGMLADRMNKRLLLAAGYALGAATAALFVIGLPTMPLLALAFILGGAYVGIEETLEDSLAAEMLPDTVRGSGFGMLAVVNGMGDFVSSLSVGWLWAAFGPTLGFAVPSVLMAAGAYVVWNTRHDHRGLSSAVPTI